MSLSNTPASATTKPNPLSNEGWEVQGFSDGEYTIKNTGTSAVASVRPLAPLQCSVLDNAPFGRDSAATSEDGGKSSSVSVIAMVQMVAAVAFGSNNIPASGGSGVSSIPATSDAVANTVTPPGVSPFPQSKDSLSEGIYFIYNLATNAQIVVYERSERNRGVGPTQLWNGPTLNHDSRKWTLKFTDDGYALITSLWPPPGPARYLSLGPNVRNRENRCRLFRVSRPEAPGGSAYYICTDSDFTMNPPLVIEDPQTPPTFDASAACTSRFELNNRNQMWVFSKAP